MRKSSILIVAAALVWGNAFAETLEVGSFRHSGPFAVQVPFVTDSTDARGRKYRIEDILDSPMSFESLGAAAVTSSVPKGNGVHLIGFAIQTQSFAKASLGVKGPDHFKVFMDGDEVLDTESLKLEPATHDIVIKLFTEKPLDSLKITVTTESEGLLSLRTDGRRIYSLDVNSHGESCRSVRVSAGGRFVSVSHSLTAKGGATASYTEILGAADGKVYARLEDGVNWMPFGDDYWTVRNTVTGCDLMSVNPADGTQKILARDIPEGDFVISPKGDCLIYSITTDGPEEGDVHQILEPDDRQPGWRDRTSLFRYDIATGFLQPITFGYHNAYLTDISGDGGKLLVMTSRMRLTQRPTTLFSVYLIDTYTLETECLVEDDGFVSDAIFSPDASKMAVLGTPEAFGGFAKEIKEGQTPSSYQNQIFLFDIADKSVCSLTEGFTVSPQRLVWSRSDGKIYFDAEDRDRMNLFRLDPKSGKTQSLPNLEDNVRGFDLSRLGSTLAYYGQSLMNGDRAYSLDTRSVTSKGTRGQGQTLLADFSATRLENVTMGQGEGYEFTTLRGDTINAFYVLPPNFDPEKKYPLLVHYYGGCSPSTRYAIGSYSPQYYAAQGYVFLVINPSGASGFGQEFAARHVNTAGDVVADDIIEGTQQFCKDHPFVDSEHIGCFSASYGGFMTQLLLSKTDIFKAGISHAGISDHTSYWGEGYWGYSYSEVSMANSYPWTRKDLYVDRSPLYNADKIHTPLLFLHGSADTNVPIGESIQMFTALKILGQDTAFVVVDGENHGIFDYSKKRQWLRTISAWFAKYLKEDSAWWDTLYPPKAL